MPTPDKRVDAYIAASQAFARPILEHVRAAVHRGCPDVEETMKWGFPHFMYRGMLCSMASFKQHCALNFWKGALLPGVPKARGGSMGQFGKIESLDDLPTEKTLVKLVGLAAKLNEAGVKTPKIRKPESKPRGTVARTPAGFLAALRANPKALAAYEAFSPSHRREYAEWIAEAKKEETRNQRIETALTWIAEGKPRTWKYMKG